MAGNPPISYEERKASSITNAKTPMQQKYGLAGSVPPIEGMVYWGSITGRQGYVSNKYEKIADAKFRWASLTGPEADRFYGTLDKYFPHGYDQSWIQNAWERALNISAERLKTEGVHVTPFQSLDLMLSQMAAHNALPGGAGGAGGGGGGAPTVTGTVNLTDPGTAKILVDQALETYLGRKANPKEMEAFNTALNRKEMASPSKTEMAGTTAVTSGGFNPSAFAEQYALGQEGSAEHQAATTFLDTFVSSLKAQV